MIFGLLAVMGLLGILGNFHIPKDVIRCHGCRVAYLAVFTNFGDFGRLLGGSSHDLYMVNNHGDRKSHKDRDIPLPNVFYGLYMGVTNYLLTGMILQARQKSDQEHNHKGIVEEMLQA